VPETARLARVLRPLESVNCCNGEMSNAQCPYHDSHIANTNVVKLYPTGELIEKPCYKFADQKKAPSALGARRG